MARENELGDKAQVEWSEPNQGGYLKHDIAVDPSVQ